MDQYDSNKLAQQNGSKTELSQHCAHLQANNVKFRNPCCLNHILTLCVTNDPWNDDEQQNWTTATNSSS